MNIRKPVDHSAMFKALDDLIAVSLPQMELYSEISWLVSGRPEKGAAVAVAEYLRGTYPNAAGSSPRNLRHYFRTYELAPEVMAKAMTIGWTQNVVILESELTLQEQAWYIQAVQKDNWSKLELQRKIASKAHLETSLDEVDGMCYTEENNTTKERPDHDKHSVCVFREHLPQPNGRVYHEGPGQESRPGSAIPHRVRRHQRRTDWGSCLPAGPPQAGEAWDQLRRERPDSSSRRTMDDTTC